MVSSGLSSNSIIAQSSKGTLTEKISHVGTLERIHETPQSSVRQRFESELQCRWERLRLPQSHTTPTFPSSRIQVSARQLSLGQNSKPQFPAQSFMPLWPHRQAQIKTELIWRTAHHPLRNRCCGEHSQGSFPFNQLIIKLLFSWARISSVMQETQRQNYSIPSVN